MRDPPLVLVIRCRIRWCRDFGNDRMIFRPRASNSSATRGRPPVISRVLALSSVGIRASTSPALTSLPGSTDRTASTGSSSGHRRRAQTSADFALLVVDRHGRTEIGASWATRASRMTTRFGDARRLVTSAPHSSRHLRPDPRTRRCRRPPSGSAACRDPIQATIWPRVTVVAVIDAQAGAVRHPDALRARCRLRPQSR